MGQCSVLSQTTNPASPSITSPPPSSSPFISLLNSIPLFLGRRNRLHVAVKSGSAQNETWSIGARLHLNDTTLIQVNMNMPHDYFPTHWRCLPSTLMHPKNLNKIIIIKNIDFFKSQSIKFWLLESALLHTSIKDCHTTRSTINNHHSIFYTFKKFKKRV